MASGSPLSGVTEAEFSAVSGVNKPLGLWETEASLRNSGCNAAFVGRAVTSWPSGAGDEENRSSGLAGERGVWERLAGSGTLGLAETGGGKLDEEESVRSKVTGASA